MIGRLIAFVIALVTATEFVHAHQAATTWDPAKTWVFAIGLLEWEDPKFAAFPQANRQDSEFVNVLKARGVADGHVVYLKDRQATTARITQEFEEFVRRPSEGDTLILYYCGHGYNSPNHRQTFLASYDASDNKPGIRVGSFLVAIESLFKGKSVIIAADHCCSGGIAESVRVLKAPRASYAVFCSAHVNSGSTGAWTFTENLVYGFRGEAFMDDNADGKITVQELAANTAEDMAFADKQMAQFTMTGDFPKGLVIANSSKPSRPKIGTRLEIDSEGQWYRGFVTDTKDEQVRVHYYGFPTSDDEWVDAKRLRGVKPQTYPDGSKVKVLSSGEWYDATIVGVRLGLHHVKFDGWEREWNEWVPADRIQPKRRPKR